MHDVGDENGVIGPAELGFEGVADEQLDAVLEARLADVATGLGDRLLAVQDHHPQLRPAAGELDGVDRRSAADFEQPPAAAEIELRAGGGGRAPADVGHGAGEFGLVAQQARIELGVVDRLAGLDRVVQTAPAGVEPGGVPQHIGARLGRVGQQMAAGQLGVAVAVADALEQPQRHQGVAQDAGAARAGFQRRRQRLGVQDAIGESAEQTEAVGGEHDLARLVAGGQLVEGVVGRRRHDGPPLVSMTPM